MIDKLVLRHFGLSLSARSSVKEKQERAIYVYEHLCREYYILLNSDLGELIGRMFNSMYPNSEISELKKLDLVLWQMKR